MLRILKFYFPRLYISINIEYSVVFWRVYAGIRRIAVNHHGDLAYTL
jgi:hypothetical protein